MKRSRWMAPVMIGSLSLTLVSCKDDLDPLQRAYVGVYNYGTVDAHFCTSAPNPAQQKLKYLFIVDHSASNKPGVTQDTTDIQNSDADGARRYGPMVNFVNNLSPDASTTPYFSIIDFNDTATQPAGLTGFESDVATFVQIAKTDWIGSTGTATNPSPDDSGFTNYQDALSLAKQIIQADVQNEIVMQQGQVIVSSVYQIIFVSDGNPVVQASGGTTLYTQQYTTDLKPVIDQILDFKNNTTYGPYISNISLNTAYYYNTNSAPSTDAVTLLQQIADEGSGLFIQFASGQQILYQQFAPPSRNVINQLADVFIENENAVWWDDGRFMLDSDGDGLPDLIEQQYGSNPDMKDSDGNGVTDLVEFRTKGKPCNDAACLAVNRDPYSICAGYNPTTDTSGNVSFKSSANDGLNDCEKFLLNGSIQSYNSNGDMIPDMLAFKNTISIQPGNSNIALADPFGDGINNYAKLKLGYPIQVSKKQLVDFDPRYTKLVVESAATDTSGVTCYHLTADTVALSSPTNKIKLYVVQNTSLIQNKPFLMTAEKQIDSNMNASFVPTDFK